LAPAETFQEALCGAPLASAYGGPVLLTYKGGLNNGVAAEMVRLAPKYVICIGLPDLVVNRVIVVLGGGVFVTSIRGTTGSVYDMSYKVANALKTRAERTQPGAMSSATAIVTVGYNFPDAIGVSPLACANGWPILLTDKGGNAPLHAKAALAISELGIVKALKVGTYAALPPGVVGVGNCSGADRYFTVAAVAAWARAKGGLAFTHTGLATGDKFPDALAAGPYLGKDHGILLLTPLYGPLPAPASALLGANATDVYRFTYIAMIEPVISQVNALLP
jgi:hypothetical protein